MAITDILHLIQQGAMGQLPTGAPVPGMMPLAQPPQQVFQSSALDPDVVKKVRQTQAMGDLIQRLQQIQQNPPPPAVHTIDPSQRILQNIAKGKSHKAAMARGERGEQFRTDITRDPTGLRARMQAAPAEQPKPRGKATVVNEATMAQARQQLLDAGRLPGAEFLGMANYRGPKGAGRETKLGVPTQAGIDAKQRAAAQKEMAQTLRMRRAQARNPAPPTPDELMAHQQMLANQQLQAMAIAQAMRGRQGGGADMKSFTDWLIHATTPVEQGGLGMQPEQARDVGAQIFGIGGGGMMVPSPAPAPEVAVPGEQRQPFQQSQAATPSTAFGMILDALLKSAGTIGPGGRLGGDLNPIPGFNEFRRGNRPAWGSPSAK